MKEKNSQFTPFRRYITASESGFTLIEMSIALVIIGLLVGAIVVGAQMVGTAAIRAQVSQITNYTTTVNAFKTKYACLPGDCNKAEAFGLGSSANPGRNGNGDEAITYAGGAFVDGFVNRSDVIATYWYPESLNFWYHLQQSGHLEGGYSGWTSGMTWDGPTQTETTPPAAAGNAARIMVSNFYCANANCRAARNGFYLFQPGTAHGTTRTGIKPSVARAIDTKMDDGLPFTGNVGCTNISALAPGTGIAIASTSGTCGYAAFPNYCNSGNSYVNSDNGECGTAFLNQF